MHTRERQGARRAQAKDASLPTSLAEEILRITTQLEDAVSEKDWASVEKQIESLDEVYHELDRQESGFNYDYE